MNRPSPHEYAVLGTIPAAGDEYGVTAREGDGLWYQDEETKEWHVDDIEFKRVIGWVLRYDRNGEVVGHPLLNGGNAFYPDHRVDEYRKDDVTVIPVPNGLEGDELRAFLLDFIETKRINHPARFDAMKDVLVQVMTGKESDRD